MCCRIIDHFNSKFVPLFYRVLVRQDKGQQQEVAKEIQDQLHWLEQHVDSKGRLLQHMQLATAFAAAIAIVRYYYNCQVLLSRLPWTYYMHRVACFEM